MKTILITGSTDGIGKLTAISLAKEGHRLILHGRNQDKLQQVVTEIKSHANTINVDSFVADLSNLHSVLEMISAVKQSYTKIDVILNNAGIFNSPVPQNKEGLDIRFAVNYCAPYLLTNGLLDLLKNSHSPRVINLSSAAQSTVSLSALQGDEMLAAPEAYAQSKLALTMWSFYLAQKWDFLNVIAVNPGSLLKTKMVQEAYGQHWSSADKGVKILQELSLSEKYAESSGTYFDNDKGTFNRAHKDAYDQEKIALLVSETEKIVRI